MTEQTHSKEEQAISKFRISGVPGNKFNVSNKTLFLDIPTTLDKSKLKIDKIYNISSTDLKAVLVHIVSHTGKCTPDGDATQRIGPKNGQIKFDNIVFNLEISKTDKLLVAFFVNNTITPQDFLEFAKIIKEAGIDTNKALADIRAGSLCGKDFLHPREQDGDVIGGAG